MGIFDDLKKMGIEPKGDLSLYKDYSKDIEDENVFATTHQMKDSILYDRKSVCPACKKEIYNRNIKARKVRLLSNELDLRPKYSKLDLLKYDIILCKHCGFAATTKLYKTFSPKQIEKIKEKITPAFKGKEYEAIYSYEVAVERYKLALYNAIVANASDITRAYICLKIAWIYRGSAEEAAFTGEDKKQKEEMEREKEFMEMALSGFEKAISTFEFPFLEFDRTRAFQVCADLARRVEKYDKAVLYAKKVINSGSANFALKEKARETIKLVKEVVGEKEEE